MFLPADRLLHQDATKRASAAKKAFVMNRIGDWGVLMGDVSDLHADRLDFVFTTRSWTATQVQSALNIMSRRCRRTRLPGARSVAGGITSVAVLLFIGATGKSAQIPLLRLAAGRDGRPDAGFRSDPRGDDGHGRRLYGRALQRRFIQNAPTAMFIVAIIGAATAIFAATIGLAQNDIKKVLAYSTVSQLGYMFLACGVGAFIAAIFHVMTHAFFKALLFLGSGSVIHGMHHEQDMRRMGNLKKYMPITFFTMLIGLAGDLRDIPIWAGFFSKDEILYKTFAAAICTGRWSIDDPLDRRRHHGGSDRRLYDADDVDDVLGQGKISSTSMRREAARDAHHDDETASCARGRREEEHHHHGRRFQTARIAVDDDRSADRAGVSFDGRRFGRHSLCDEFHGRRGRRQCI